MSTPRPHTSTEETPSALRSSRAGPDGVNTLDSFDSFHNAGSLTFGATLQILP